jgi:hypothetical protein
VPFIGSESGVGSDGDSTWSRNWRRFADACQDTEIADGVTSPTTGAGHGVGTQGGGAPPTQTLREIGALCADSRPRASTAVTV